MNRASRPGPTQSPSSSGQPAPLPLSWAFAVFFCLCLAALVYVIAAVALNSRAASSRSHTAPLPGRPNDAVISSWAQVLPYNGKSTLTLDYLPEKKSAGPITLQVTAAGSGFVFEDPAAPGLQGQLAVTLAPGPDSHKDVTLVNTSSGGGVFSASARVLVSLDDGKAMPPVDELPVVLEPAFQLSMRTNALVANQPAAVAGPILGAVASLAGLYWRRREEELPLKQAEAAARLARLRAALVDCDLTAASRELKTLKQKNLGALLGEADWEWSERLASLAEGSVFINAQRDLLRCPSAWYDERAGALLALGRQIDPDDTSAALFQAYVAFMKSFSFEGCTRHTETEGAALLKALAAGPLGYADWPPLPGEPVAIERMPRREKLANPFISPRAEDETPYLFNASRGLFWLWHPAYRQVAPDTPPADNPITCLHGVSGSGLTAFALQYGRCSGRPILDALVDARESDENSLTLALASRLAEFACAAPGQLSRLDGEGKRALAELLCSQLGVTAVRQRFARRRDELPPAPPASEKRDPFVEEPRAQLGLFLSTLERASLAPMRESVWLQTLRAIGGSFGLSTFRVVIHQGGEDFNDWLAARRAHLGRLRVENFQVIFVLHESTFERARGALAQHGVIDTRLAWDETQLGLMAAYRWNMYNNEDITARYRDLYRSALGRSGCLPAEFIRQWRIGLGLSVP